MKISYAITVCNELEEIKRLVPFLKTHKRPEDEVVVLFDQKNGDKEVIDYLVKFNKYPNIQTWRGYFENDFGDWKNKLTSYCTGDYIFQLDADEMISEYMMQLLPQVLEANDVEVIRVPRINTVEGLTQEHIQKWSWQVNEKGWVNFPDYQWRIYKNNAGITWLNKVHEVLTGYRTMAALPPQEEWCLLHHKQIERQERQNSYYEQLG